MQLFQQSEATAARRRVPVYLVDATDGITPETGETGGQPQLSKNGAAWGNTSATLVAIGNGGYYVELTAGELDTLGFAKVRYKSANTAEFNWPIQILPWDPYDSVRAGFTALPNAAAEAAGGLYTRGTGAGQINQQTNGQVDVNIEEINNNSTAASKLATSADTMVTGTVDDTAFAPTTTEFETSSVTEATADHFNGARIIFVDNALQFQRSVVTDYQLTGGRGHFTVRALTEAPQNTWSWILV